MAENQRNENDSRRQDEQARREEQRAHAEQERLETHLMSTGMRRPGEHEGGPVPEPREQPEVAPPMVGPPLSQVLRDSQELARQYAERHPGYGGQHDVAPNADMGPRHTPQPPLVPPLPRGFVMPPGGGDGEVLPPPKAYYATGSSYLVGVRDFLASSFPSQVVSYTFDAAAVSADANGDKIVYEGTILQMSTGQLVKPRTGSGDAIGILRRRINARDGNVDVGVVIGGAVNVTKLWDDGTFGKSLGTLTADNIPAETPFIHYRNEDI